MGAKWLLYWQATAGASLSSQTLAEITRVLESLIVTKLGRWQVVCALHRPFVKEGAGLVSLNGVAARELFGVTLWNAPDDYFMVLRNEHLVVQADPLMVTAMEKLQLYKHRLSITFEGSQYSLNNFEVRVGKVALSTSDNIRGIVLEVENLVTPSMEKGRAAVDEFQSLWDEVVSGQNLSGHFMLLEVQCAEFGLSDQFTPQHSALQYVTYSVMASRT